MRELLHVLTLLFSMTLAAFSICVIKDWVTPDSDSAYLWNHYVCKQHYFNLFFYSGFTWRLHRLKKIIKNPKHEQNQNKNRRETQAPLFTILFDKGLWPLSNRGAMSPAGVAPTRPSKSHTAEKLISQLNVDNWIRPTLRVWGYNYPFPPMCQPKI